MVGMDMNVNRKIQHTCQNETTPSHQKFSGSENTVLIYSRKCFINNILGRFSRNKFPNTAG
jgi:hypothetical protein